MKTHRSFVLLFSLVLVLFAMGVLTPQAFAATTTFTSLLKVGSSGSEVTALQKTLVAQGFLATTPNGNFGPATLAALKKFQTAHKISPLGYTGPSTRAVLNGLKTAASASKPAASIPASTATLTPAQQLIQLQATLAALQAKLTGTSSSTTRPLRMTAHLPTR